MLKTKVNFGTCQRQYVCAAQEKKKLDRFITVRGKTARSDPKDLDSILKHAHSGQVRVTYMFEKSKSHGIDIASEVNTNPHVVCEKASYPHSHSK